MNIYSPKFRTDLDEYSQNLLMHITETFNIPYSDLIQSYVAFSGRSCDNSKKHIKNKNDCNTSLEYIVIKEKEFLIDPTTCVLYTFTPKCPVRIGTYDTKTSRINLQQN